MAAPEPKPPPKPRKWICPRCQQGNDPDERWCMFCKLDIDDVNDVYREIAAG